MDEGHETPSRIERLIHSPTVRSTYASLVTHVLILIGLALLLIPTRKEMRPRPIVIAMADAEAIDVVPGNAAGGGETGSDEIVVPRTAEQAPPSDDLVPVDSPIVPVIEPVAIAPEAAAIAPSTNHPTPVASVQAIAASLAPQPRRGSMVPGQAPFEGRRGPARGHGVLDRGGSAASEEAVERGLAWLARHQAADGSWRFDLSGCRCDGG